MAKEPGITVLHATLMRWVNEFSLKLESKVKRHLKFSTDSLKLDETYIKVKGVWHYLYRSVDSNGNTIDWMLSRYRNKHAANRFSQKMLSNGYCIAPRIINVDKDKSFPPAFAESKASGDIPAKTKFREVHE